jgi:hypothetical protein
VSGLVEDHELEDVGTASAVFDISGKGDRAYAQKEQETGSPEDHPFT